MTSILRSLAAFLSDRARRRRGGVVMVGPLLSVKGLEVATKVRRSRRSTKL